MPVPPGSGEILQGLASASLGQPGSQMWVQSGSSVLDSIAWGRGGALGGGKDGGQHFSGSAPAWQDFYDVSFFMDSTHSPDIITLDNHGKHIGPFPAKQKVNFLPNFFKETTFFNFPLFALQWPSLQPSTPYILL